MDHFGLGTCSLWVEVGGSSAGTMYMSHPGLSHDLHGCSPLHFLCAAILPNPGAGTESALHHLSPAACSARTWHGATEPEQEGRKRVAPSGCQLSQLIPALPPHPAHSALHTASSLLTFHFQAVPVVLILGGE